MPACDPAAFDPSLHSREGGAGATCQAESVRGAHAAARFASFAFSMRFGAFPAFWMASAPAAGFDVPFVIHRRDNRPRVVRPAAREGRHRERN